MTRIEDAVGVGLRTPGGDAGPSRYQSVCGTCHRTIYFRDRTPLQCGRHSCIECFLVELETLPRTGKFQLLLSPENREFIRQILAAEDKPQ